MNYIGKYIKSYRGNVSLRNFAEKCGISHTHLDSIEKGFDPRTGKPVKVTVDTLKKIAKAMNMSVNDLLINSGDVDIEKDFINSNYKIDDLIKLLSENIEILTDDDKDTIKFIIEKRKREFEKEKNN